MSTILSFLARTADIVAGKPTPDYLPGRGCSSLLTRANPKQVGRCIQIGRTPVWQHRLMFSDCTHGPHLAGVQAPSCCFMSKNPAELFGYQRYPYTPGFVLYLIAQTRGTPVVKNKLVLFGRRLFFALPHQDQRSRVVLQAQVYQSPAIYVQPVLHISLFSMR